MVEKLTIHNFAGIQHLEIEVKRVNILIGSQASGKSICAKLLFYFKNFVWEILSIIENEQTKRALDTIYCKKFEEYFPPESWGQEDFSIRYEISNVFIEINKTNKNKLFLTYADFFKQELTNLRGFLKRSNNSKLQGSINYDSKLEDLYLVRRLTKSILVESLINSICPEAAFSQLFIPAGRSFFANLQSNIFSFLSNNNSLDPFLREFGSTYESIKGVNLTGRNGFIEKDSKNIQEEVNVLIEKSLCGKYVHEKGRDLLETVDGRRINIANSSSGQQEILPLTIILSSLPFLAPSSAGQTVYIEEPEAHLFPNAQRSIMELIITIFNFRKERLQFFITTHSPYVLTVLNNLLQAGSLYENRDLSDDVRSQLEKIIPQHKSLNIADVSAYVLRDGKCESIICNDTGLINANFIDSVSDDLAVEFDQLLDLT